MKFQSGRFARARTGYQRAGFIWLLLFPLAWLVLADAPGQQISARLRKLTRGTQWRLVNSIPVNFNTYHPQGMVKIGEHFYVSSVEVRRPTRRFASPEGGFDRDPGEGIGHLFKFDARGNRLADLTLGEGTIYHPGGIDYDGRVIWVPVAEYRPGSRSIVYQVDPATMKATEVFRFADHLGGIVHDTSDQTLHGISWGSRFYYRWRLDRHGRMLGTNLSPEKSRQPNPAFYIDYQDCKYLGRHEMVCGGLSQYQRGRDGVKFSLGGLELVDLSQHQPRFQLPIELWTNSGLPMTQNPFWLEPTHQGLRAYFLPEDENSTLYIYEVDIPNN